MFIQDWVSQLCDATNVNGKTAMQLAQSCGAMELAKGIEQCKREAILLRDGAVELQERILLICGFEKVGKTTFLQNVLSFLQRSFFGKAFRYFAPRAPPRTAGFTVSRMTIPQGGDEPWVVVDFAGHIEYYITHEMMLSTGNGIFVVMCRLSDEWCVNKQAAPHENTSPRNGVHAVRVLRA